MMNRIALRNELRKQKNYGAFAVIAERLAIPRSVVSNAFSNPHNVKKLKRDAIYAEARAYLNGRGK